MKIEETANKIRQYKAVETKQMCVQLNLYSYVTVKELG